MRMVCALVVAALGLIAVSDPGLAATIDTRATVKPPTPAAAEGAPQTGCRPETTALGSIGSLTTMLITTPAFAPLGMQAATTMKSDPVWVAMLALVGSGLVTLGIVVRRKLFKAEGENEPA